MVHRFPHLKIQVPHLKFQVSDTKICLWYCGYNVLLYHVYVNIDIACAAVLRLQKLMYLLLKIQSYQRLPLFKAVVSQIFVFVCVCVCVCVCVGVCVGVGVCVCVCVVVVCVCVCVCVCVWCACVGGF